MRRPKVGASNSTKAKPVSAGSMPEIVLVHGRVHPALKRYLGYALSKTAVRLKAMVAKRLNSFEIIPVQNGIMRLLEETGPMNQASIGETMGIDKATMVKLIDGLESLKYIKRTPSSEDRRAKFVSLTEKGTKVLVKTSKEVSEAELEFLAPLNESERKTFTSLLDKILSSSAE